MDPWAEHMQPPEQAGGAEAGPLLRQAAVAVWVTATVSILLFGACTSLLTIMGLLPPELMREQIEDEAARQQIDQFADMQSAILLSAGLLLLFIVLPGVVYLYTGFRIRAGGRGAISLTRGMMIVQACVVGAYLLMATVGSLMMGDICGVAMPLLVFGALLALLIWSIRLLKKAGQKLDFFLLDPDEPWNKPETRGL